MRCKNRPTDLLVRRTNRAQGATGQAVRITEWGSQAGLSLEHVSRVVTELEQPGLVERKPNPDDKRSFFAALTAWAVSGCAGAPAYLAAIEQHYSHHVTEPEFVTIAASPRKVVDAEYT